MPHAGYANSIMNGGPGFHSNISDGELSEPVTRAIEVTLPTPTLPFQCISIHSSILIHPSIAYVIAASQCVASRNGSRLI